MFMRRVLPTVLMSVLLFPDFSWGSAQFSGDPIESYSLKRKNSTFEDHNKRKKLEVKEAGPSYQTHFTDALFNFDSGTQKQTSTQELFNTLKGNLRGPYVDLTTAMKVHMCLELALNGGAVKVNQLNIPSTISDLILSDIFSPLLGQSQMTFQYCADDTESELKYLLYNLTKNLSLSGVEEQQIYILIKKVDEEYMEVLSQALLRLFNSKGKKTPFLGVFTTLEQVLFKDFTPTLFRGFFLTGVKVIELIDPDSEAFQIVPCAPLAKLETLFVELSWNSIFKLDGASFPSLKKLTVSGDEFEKHSNVEELYLRTLCISTPIPSKI